MLIFKLRWIDLSRDRSSRRDSAFAR